MPQAEGAVLGVWSPVLEFQVAFDYNGTQTMGGGRCFLQLMSLSRMIKEGVSDDKKITVQILW